MLTDQDIQRAARQGRVVGEREFSEGVMLKERENAMSIVDPDGNLYLICGHRIRTDVPQYLYPESRSTARQFHFTLREEGFEESR